MSELPPLPESDDPHELLGVPESADEMAIKRAYLRLIRIYRPERAPEAFQRLHQAYERALEYVSWSRWIEPDDERTEADATGMAVAGGHPLHDTLREAWETLAAGDPEGARRQIEAARRDRPACVVTAAHRALLAEALGDAPEHATRPLVSLIGQDAPVAPWVTSVFQPADVDAELALDTSRWARLRAQPERHAAAYLLRRRWHRMLREGRLDDAIEEALDPAYVDDAHDDPWLLAHAAQEVALAAAWRRPEQAARLFAEHGHGAHHGDGTFTLEDQYHLIRMEGLDQAFRTAFDDDPLPAQLERWYTLWPILDPDEQRDLARALTADVERSATPCLTAFDRMAEVDMALIGRHADSLLHVGLPADTATPLLQRERVRRELEVLAGSLPRRSLGRRRRHYAERMRAVFVRAVVELAISPRHIAWWLSSTAHRISETRGSAAMAYHRQALLDDGGLIGLYLTCRLRELGRSAWRVR